MWGERNSARMFSYGWCGSRWWKPGLDIREQWASCDDVDLSCCECNITDPEKPFKSVMDHTDFVSSCPRALCNANALMRD